MALTDSPDTYLADFGVAVSAGVVSGLGILDMPDQNLSGMAQSTEYSVLCKYSDFGGLKNMDAITVNSVAYTVRENHKLDDGTFCRILLEKT